MVDEFNIKLKPEVPIWASGTNSLAISGGGTVTLDDSVDLDPNADTITFGTDGRSLGGGLVRQCQFAHAQDRRGAGARRHGVAQRWYR